MRALIRCLPLIALLPTACTVGPDYHRPVVTSAAAPWAGPHATDAGAPDLAPWTRLGDPVLADLVARAVAANPDLAEAEGRLNEARATLGQARAAQGPQANLSASGQQTQTSLNGQFPAASIPFYQRDFALYDAGFDASWEIDLWGGNRRAVESARAQIDAAAARLTDTRLRVVAEVVRAYAQFRGGQALLEATRSDAAAQAELATLIRQRLNAGESTRFDETRAREQARTARAPIAGIEADIAAALATLALLTGRAPEALTDIAQTSAPLPALPRNLAVGTRADMVRRRPDVRAAEADLAAATAGIGMETANLYPRLTLSGGLDFQARNPADLITDKSLGFAVGPHLSWALFDAGRVRARIHAADARADQAAARYTRAILSALADSETAINRYAAAQTTLAEREAALAANRQSYDQALARASAGEDDRLALLQAQSALSGATRAATQAREAAFEAYAALVKALGGGWAEHGP
jgi:NodT family efflux transporter outer membrane factor (OMF) lipoprotein